MNAENYLQTNSSEDHVTNELVALLSKRLKTTVQPEQELFTEGLINSMFALELVVQIETQFDIEVEGRDLDMENFRSVNAMASLVNRLIEK
ncbi:D-alanine--poly(phosphoribitol) ligase subunit 2 [Mycobacterium basiliense]|uniref:D-alanine--poly(Phosphoribitol) ligase subunit 2 n=1 Tax=Mycobacterium basiliense TaxID=2094119 RepID=A0A3S4FNJ9_9MYCO|nr:phosphopantetheine-binding protein [Mycobacterium basiliense]VDM89181.1 D-alanine--poly(phosphoribitol) ligase subunit 2 [Mycobacterium basiliense]